MPRLCYLITLWVLFMAVGCSASTPVLPATPTPLVTSTIIIPSTTPTSLPSITQPLAMATVTRSPTATRIPPTPTVNAGEGCSGGERVVVLLLDPCLVNGIRAGLDQFTATCATMAIPSFADWGIFQHRQTCADTSHNFTCSPSKNWSGRF